MDNSSTNSGYLTLSALRGYELLDNGKFDQHKLIEL